MQQQFFQAFRTGFNLIKGVIYIVFTILLGIDLNEVYSPIKTGITVAAVFAALLLFGPLVEILLMVGVIALVVAVAHGPCSNPTMSGIRYCVTTWGGAAFYAIIDVIHRLLDVITPAVPPGCPFD
jgi:hypothetical protein